MPSSDRVEPTQETTDVIGARIGAQVVDVIVMFVQLVVVGIGFAMLANPRSSADVEGYVYLAAITLPLYGGILEAYWNGQTLGKRLAGIKVVDRRGDTPSIGAALGRNLPAVIVFSWLTTAVALAAIAMDDRNQRVFDDLAGTYVVDANPVSAGRSRSGTSRQEEGRNPL